MFDVWMGGMELTTVVLIVSVVVLLPVQLVLCFRVQSLITRLLPVLLLFLLTMLLVVMSVSATGWNGFGYLILAAFSAMMLLLCGVGWGIWAVVRFARRK